MGSSRSFYKEARLISLRTKIKELAPQAKGYNVNSVSKRLNEQLLALQEEYKALSGDYLKDFMPVNEEDYLTGLKEQLNNVCGNYSKHIDPKDIATMLKEVAKEYEAKA